jgi:hypothetical protein
LLAARAVNSAGSIRLPSIREPRPIFPELGKISARLVDVVKQRGDWPTSWRQRQRIMPQAARIGRGVTGR